MKAAGVLFVLELIVGRVIYILQRIIFAIEGKEKRQPPSAAGRWWVVVI